MTDRSSVPMVAKLATIVWGWIVVLLFLLMFEAFSEGFLEGWRALTNSPALLVFFFCLPFLAFTGSVVLAWRMSHGDLRDRPLAIVLLVIGIPWALMQTFAMLLGILIRRFDFSMVSLPSACCAGLAGNDQVDVDHAKYLFTLCSFCAMLAPV